jgi:hypothetical protein
MLSKFLKLIAIADKRIADIRSGEKPALTQMQMLSILLKWLLILIWLRSQ